MKPLGIAQTRGETIPGLERRPGSLFELESSVLDNQVDYFGHEKLRKVMKTRKPEVARLILELGDKDIIETCMQYYVGSANNKDDMRAGIRSEIRILERVAAKAWFPESSAMVRGVLEHFKKS